MKLIAKTPTGYLAEVSTGEVMMLSDGQLPEYQQNDYRPADYTGRELKITEAIRFANALRKSGREAEQACAMLEAFAAMLRKAVPEVIAPVEPPKTEEGV